MINFQLYLLAIIFAVKINLNYRSPVDLSSTGMIIIDFILDSANYIDIDYLPLKTWILKQSTKAVKQIYELDKDKDQLIDIIKYIVTIKPEDRFSVNNIYKKNTLIVYLKNVGIVKSLIQITIYGLSVQRQITVIKIEIIASNTNLSEPVDTANRSSDNGVAKPIQPYPRI